MKIIHISDFHYDKNTAKDATSIRDNLVNKINEIHNETPIDLIIFSGDLINQGGKSFDGKTAVAFKGFKMYLIDPILKKTGLSEKQFIFTIGNHDIKREADSEFIEIGLKNSLTTVEKVNNFYDTSTEEGIKRVKEFKLFEKNYYKDFNKDSYHCTNFESCFILNIGNQKIGIASLNTAWRCWDSNQDKGSILIGERQINNAIDFIKDCDIKIALSHHHYSWCSDFDSYIIEKILTSSFDLYFCGHTHSKNAGYHSTLDGKMFTFTSPGILSKNRLNSSSQYENGFSYINYDIEEGKVRAHFYNQDYPLAFKINSKVAKDGVWEEEIPLGDNAQKKLEKQKIIMSIKEGVNNLNECLLSYNTSSSAPKSLDDIFVMPNIIIKEDEDEEVLIKDLSELITSEKNYIIFGIKESGKTILLSKILLDILKVGTSQKYIPACIDFSNTNKSIDENLRNYWGLSKSSLNSVLLNNDILLLIDNIIFHDDYLDNITRLRDFIAKYPKTRFIATSLQLFDDDYPINTEYEDLLKFSVLKLKQFKSKQIKKLIQKWFPNNPQYDTPKKLNTLISAFLSFNLPRTPFAVSMFLWIIERQQNYRPLNNATLIEKFIEELLDKKNIAGVLRETFDYENKIWLLSEIAYQMLEKDNLNYALPYSELCSIVEKHLNKRKFPKSYQSKKIIGEILQLSILVEEGNDVRFRFNCFFEYFLVKKMQNSPEFLESVLEEKNYLKFSNEINYYTGLYRGNKDILKLLISRLEYDYIEINDIVFSKVKSIDDFFHIDRSLIENIKADELVELLPNKQTEEEGENLSDKKLEQCEPENGNIKRKDSDKIMNYGKILLLAMHVLKNSEEVDETDLKFNSYSTILKNAISYIIVYKMIIEQMVKHEDHFPKDRVKSFKIILRFLPVALQSLISEGLGTYKLAEVICEKIEKDSKDRSISELEQFLSACLYYDIKGDEYKNKLNDFIKTIKRTYIADACLMKLYGYYYASTSEKDDSSILNHLADLYIRVNSNRKSNKVINKSALMQDLKHKKKSYIADK